MQRPPPDRARTSPRVLRARRAHRARIRRRRLGALAVLLALAAIGVLVARSGGESDGGTPGGRSASGDLPSEPVHFTVAASGDLLIHSPIFQRALALGDGRRYDFRPMLRSLKRWIGGADLAICHFEAPMTSGPPQGYPVFNTPPALARAVKATGWDVCDTASNHSLDRAQAGINATVRALDRAGLKHTGSFRSAAARRDTTMIDVRGIRVAFLAYTETTNGIPLPHSWSLNRARSSRILADARRARRRGAQAVIVNLHWGNEYQHEPSAAQLRLARRLTRSRQIDAILGQHVHVVQPIRYLNGKPVVFGEGNLLSNQTAACCPAASQDGMIALLDFTMDAGVVRADRVRYLPTWVRHPDYTVLPVGRALRLEQADGATLRASYRRTVSAVGRSERVKPIPARLR